MRALSEFLTDLRKRNIRLWLDGEDLGFSAPPGALAGPILAELKQRKGEVVTFFKQAAAKPAMTIEAGSGDGRLSYAQERLWFLDQLEPGNPFYNVALALRLTGDLRVEALQKGLDSVIARHEVLRTTFPAEGGRARQVIAEPVSTPLPLIDLSDLVGEAQETELYRLAYEEAKRPFDLAKGPLLRGTLIKLRERDHAFLLTMHHIISDGWSLGVLVQEIGTVYAGTVMGQALPLPELPVQYDDFAVWQRSEAYQKRLAQQLEYWREQLAAIPPELTLPTDRPRPPQQSFKGSSVSFKVPVALTAKLRRLSQAEGGTLFMTLSAALTALLHRYSHQNDILLGTPIANRTLPELEKLVGFFVNTLVLRSDVSADLPFRSLLRTMRKTALDAFAHQDLPFEMLVDALQPERDLSRNPIFQVMFALQNAPLEDLALPGLQIGSLETKRTAALFDWVLDMWETADSLTGVLEFNTDLFDETTIERFIGHFLVLLEGVVTNPDAEIGALPLLPAAEKRLLLEAFAGPVRENYPLDSTIHALFEAQVARTPERVAVSHHGRSLSYGELNGRANRIAHLLREAGVRDNDFVAILDERGIDFLASILGIHKAGGAYLPIDPSYPQDRVQYMLSNSQVAWVITRQTFIEQVDLGQTAVTTTVLLDNASTLEGYSEENLVHRTTGRDRAYMLYTSGSTGLPKGAIIRHDGAINHMYGEFELLDFDENSAFLQSAPSSSDISVWQFLGPVLVGGRTVIADMETVADPVALFDLIKRERISIIELVPVVLKGLLDRAAELSTAEAVLPDLIWCMVTGEAVQAALINQWLEAYGDIPIINAYGPTEAADDVTQHVMREPLALDGRSVPVGKPLPNLQIYVVDERMEIVPIGVTGEICVGGVGVGEGYWRNEEKTKESFVEGKREKAKGKNGSYGSIVETQGHQSKIENRKSKIYRTGDRGRWLPDGTIEYIERIDQQVKVRGFRIELGEIEGVLDQAVGVEKSATAVRPDAFGEKQLVAYVVADKNTEGSDNNEDASSLEDEQVTLWQDLHEQSYRATLLLDDDPFLNVIGWDSNYTNEALPKEQMYEYIEDTVARAMALRPSRVLEIGCGTGMIAFQLLQHVESYWGTDISEVAIAGIQRVQGDSGLQVRSPKLAAAVFEARAADHFAGWEAGQFDLALLPSVVQYFPSIDYLREVLTGLAQILDDGGAIYVGDVRSLHLLEAFHASVQLYKADEGVTASALKQRVWQQLQQEQEMAIDPAFFEALAADVPEISAVEILPKRGWHQNEMTRFRYDVVLKVKRVKETGERGHLVGAARLGTDPTLLSEATTNQPVRPEGVTTDKNNHQWGADGNSLVWDVAALEIEEIEARMQRGESFALQGVANERVAMEMSLLRWLETAGPQETKAYFMAQWAGNRRLALEPEALYALGEKYGCDVDIRVALGRVDGAFDVAFASRKGKREKEKGKSGVYGFNDNTGERELDSSLVARHSSFIKPWWQYANNPLREKLARRWVPQWREFAKGRLPGHMVPNQFVLLDQLPLTPMGKVDRAGLPTPDPERRASTSGYLPPTNDVEAAVCQIWQDVLGLPQVGIQDNFFDLGGHSLKATQVISRVTKDLQITIPLRELFNFPTVAAFAAQIGTGVKGDFSPIPRQADQASYRLSNAQHRLWVLAQMDGGSAAYNMPGALLWEGLLDKVALQTALDQLVARHEVLRTRFELMDGEPRQIIEPDLRIEIVWEPGSGRESGWANALADADAVRPFNLATGPLLRLTMCELAVDRHVMLLNMHHIVSDAWSEGVLMREFTRLYEGARTGVAIALPELAIQYRDYAAWQHEYLVGDAGEADGAFWRKQLAGEIPALDFPSDLPRPAVKTYNGKSYRLVLDRGQTAGLQTLSREQDATLFMTLTALTQALLYRYTNQDDILLGTPVHGRNHPDLEDQVGFYINTVVLRQSDIEGDRPFVRFLEDVKGTVTAAFDHQDYPFDRLVQELNLQRDVSRNPVFDVAIVYQSVAPEPAALSGVEIRPFVTAYEGSKFDLSFTFEPLADDAGLQLDIVFNTDLYEVARIERLAGHFETLVDSVLRSDEQTLDRLNILPEAERVAIEAFQGEGGNGIAADTSDLGWEIDVSDELPGKVRRSSLVADHAKGDLVAWFEAQVERTPDHVAVQFEGEKLSYKALNERANRVAHYLLDEGVTAETLVGLFVERSLHMVVAIVGILKAGAAYVPFDPSSPAERLAFMLEDSQAPILLTERGLSGRLTTGTAKIALVDGSEIEGYGAHNPNVVIEGDQLAYIIYTSGSTGRPKGVMVSHHNGTRLFTETERWYGFNERDVWTLFHSYAFDFSVWEIWGALLYGGRLVIVPYLTSRAPEAFYELVATEGVTVLNQTPSAFRQFMGVDEQKRADLGLRYVIFGGEALDIPGLRPWFERHGDERPRLINMYGITETTVHVTYRPITAADVGNRASVIGEPISDLTVHILDKAGRPAPIGITGEMYVGGAGVARGYLNRPKLTEERFVKGKRKKEKGKRESGNGVYSSNDRVQDRARHSSLGTGDSKLYRTGDLARWLPNGDIEYLGRIDSQVKVRGFRIELGEIEAVLAEADGVETAVVLVRDDGRGQQLVGYLVGEDGAIDVTQVKRAARSKLPEYMVPAVLMALKELPLTGNGKLDRKGLPVPQIGQRAAVRMAPKNALQQQVAAVWQDILGVDQVGIDENFFDLGGDSLRIIQVQQKLSAVLERDVDVVMLFQYPTVAALVVELEKGGEDTAVKDTAEENKLTRTKEAGSRAERQKAARAKRNRRRR